MDELTPIGDKVLIRKCAVGEQGDDGEFRDGGIILPDTVWDSTNWVEVISVGPRCKLYTKNVGATTWCPESPESLTNAGLEESYWWVREKDLVPLLFDDNTIQPLKGMVVLEVEARDDGLYIPEKNKLKAEHAKVVAIGEGVYDLERGMTVLCPVRGWRFAVGERELLCVQADKIEGIVDNACLI